MSVTNTTVDRFLEWKRTGVGSPSTWWWWPYGGQPQQVPAEDHRDQWQVNIDNDKARIEELEAELVRLQRELKQNEDRLLKLQEKQQSQQRLKPDERTMLEGLQDMLDVQRREYENAKTEIRAEIDRLDQSIKDRYDDPGIAYG